MKVSSIVFSACFSSALMVHHVAVADGVVKIQNALEEDELSMLLQRAEKGGSEHHSYGHDDRTMAPTKLPGNIAQRLYKKLISDSSSSSATCEDDSLAQDLNQDVIDVTTILRTTRHHQDFITANQDLYTTETKLEEGTMVGFVALESNPDAKFVHGSEEFAIERGTMLKFDGSVAHHTTLENRRAAAVASPVRILGPFAWKANIGFTRSTPELPPPDGKKSKTSGPKSAKSGGNGGNPITTGGDPKFL